MNALKLPPMLHIRRHRLLLLFLTVALTGCGDGKVADSVNNAGTISTPQYPETLPDLNAFYPAVQDSQNAAIIYQQAFAKMIPPNKDSRHLPLVGKGELPQSHMKMPATMRRAVEKWLEQNTETVTLLIRANALKECRYPVNYNDGFQARMPHLNEARTASYLLTLRTILAAEDGKASQAVDGVSQILALSQSLKKEPSSISQEVRLAILSLVAPLLERIVTQASPGEVDLQKLAGAFAAAIPEGATKTATIGERCLNLELLAGGVNRVVGLMNEANPEATPLNQVMAALGGDYDFKADSEFYRRSVDEFLAESEHPFPARLNNLQKLVTAARANKHLVSGLLLRPIERVNNREARITAVFQAAMAAIAIELHRLKHGGVLPSSLNALVPEQLAAVPLDPFTGRELLFLPRATGYVVYSVGADLTDNQGQVRTDNNPTNYDLVVTVKR
jgi:hypothetical protein